MGLRTQQQNKKVKTMKYTLRAVFPITPPSAGIYLPTKHMVSRPQARANVAV